VNRDPAAIPACDDTVERLADDGIIRRFDDRRRLGDTRDAVIDAVLRRLELSQKQAAEAYTLAEEHETNPRSVWAVRSVRRCGR
jgi:hypothetical protein